MFFPAGAEGVAVFTGGSAVGMAAPEDVARIKAVVTDSAVEKRALLAIDPSWSGKENRKVANRKGMLEQITGSSASLPRRLQILIWPR